MAADIYCIEDVLLNLSHMEKNIIGKKYWKSYITSDLHGNRGTNIHSIEKKQNEKEKWLTILIFTEMENHWRGYDKTETDKRGRLTVRRVR